MDKRDDFEEEEENKEPAFNDALPTLTRVAVPLDEIRLLDYMYPPNSPEKQRAFIDLIKRFFILSTPLMKKKESDNYKNEILNFQLKKSVFVRNGIQKVKNVYDPKLDRRLNEILIELQQILRKYFMPEKREDEGL